MLLGEEGIKLPNSLIEHSKRDTVIAGSHSLFYINVKFIHNHLYYSKATSIDIDFTIQVFLVSNGLSFYVILAPHSITPHDSYASNPS
jgi:hypothetical protein